MFPWPEDCRDHQWYREDEDTDVCRHCLSGERPHEPIPTNVDLRFRRMLAREALRGSDASRAGLERLEESDRELGRVVPRSSYWPSA